MTRFSAPTGFAGVWAAVCAARVRTDAASDARITLVSAGDDLVNRPRLYQPVVPRVRVPLDHLLGPVGVRRVAGIVTGIDADAHQVRFVDRDGIARATRYRRLVLAAGSRLRPPRLPGARHVFAVDTLEQAARLDAHLAHLHEAASGPGRFTAAVIGAGFTGIHPALFPAPLAQTVG